MAGILVFGAGMMQQSAVADAWYYFFSTIPQVFAATHGITFALVFYRLQKIEEAIHATAESLRTFADRVNLTMQYRRDCEVLAIRRDWDGYLAALTRLIPADTSSRAAETTCNERRCIIGFSMTEIRRLLAQKSLIWRRLRCNLVLTVCVIAMTSSAIPLGLIIQWHHLAMAWAISVGMTVVTLALQFRLLWAIVKPPLQGPTG